MIKKLREKTGLSQRKFAEELGIPVRTIQEWEQGRSRPPAYVINMIKKIIDIDNINNFQYIENKVKVKTEFKVCIDNPFPNCKKIYPIQQRKVKQLYDILSQNDNVTKIIVFGSSVTQSCHIGSDVDIYCEIKKYIYPINCALDFPFDLWTNFTVDERLKSEIDKKGVIIYEK